MILILLANLNSCKHQDKNLSDNSSPPKYIFDVDFSDVSQIKQKLEATNDFENQENIHNVKKMITNYYLNKNFGNKYGVSLLPNSKTKIVVNSFCGSFKKAIPEKNEVYQWVKGFPKIQLLDKLLKYYKLNSMIDQNKMQELIWNLENKTYYEDYPEDLKKIINNIVDNPDQILPNRASKKIIDFFSPIDFMSEIKIIFGEYNTFDEFNKLLKLNKIKTELSEKQIFNDIDNFKVKATTQSNNFTSQIITFYNYDDKIIKINLEEFYLVSQREEVQPIILSSVFVIDNKIQLLFEKYAYKLLGYLASHYPTLNSNEKKLVKQNPIESAIVYYNGFIAEQNAEKYFPNSPPRGKSDAFRHYVWAALLTRDLGEELARKYLNAHELDSYQSGIDFEMDNFNNELGIKGAKDLLKNGEFSDIDIFNKAIEEINSKKLKVLNYAEK